MNLGNSWVKSEIFRTCAKIFSSTGKKTVRSIARKYNSHGFFRMKVFIMVWVDLMDKALSNTRP